MLESLFIKVVGLKTCSSIKKRLQHMYFSVKFAKFLRTTFFAERIRWLLLEISQTLSLLHLRTMNRVTSWYVLTPQPLFYFMAYVSFLSISFFFSYFFLWILLPFGFKVS